jgi:hypothetical protein
MAASWLGWQWPERIADVGQSDGKLASIRTEPLLCSLGVWTMALDGQPEFSGVIRKSQMDRFVRDEVAKHEVRCEDQPPVERQNPASGAVSPFRPLPHDVYPLRALSKACRYSIQVLPDLHACPSPQPVFQATRYWCLGARSQPHYDLAIDETDEISAPSGRRLYNAHPGALTAKKDLTSPPLGNTYLPQPVDALKLIEYPFLILIQKSRYLVVGPIDRLHDLDAVDAHPYTQLTG